MCLILEKEKEYITHNVKMGMIWSIQNRSYLISVKRIKDNRKKVDEAHFAVFYMERASAAVTEQLSALHIMLYNCKHYRQNNSSPTSASV